MFNISTLPELIGRARQSFNANLRGADAYLFPNNVYVSSKVIGGQTKEIMDFADYISRQKFVVTADDENLELHAAEVGLARKPAQPASSVTGVTLTTAGDCSADVGAVFARLDGVQYRATLPASRLGAGSLDVSVVAVVDGAAGNADAGVSLDIVSGVTGDATAAVAAGGIKGGLDVELSGDFFTTDLATLRGRVLFRKRNPPHGGAPPDYVTWCGEVSGVTRTFVERRWGGVGTVRVFPLMDGLFDNGIPDTAALARVQDHLESVAPSGCLFTVAAPNPVTVDLTVTGLSPDTTTVREAALTELRSAFLRLSRVAGNDREIGGLPFLAYPTGFSRSWLWQAIANAAGEKRHVLSLPSSDPVLTAGDMAVLGDVTWAS